MTNKYDKVILDADNTLFDYDRAQIKAINSALNQPEDSKTYEIIFGYANMDPIFWDKVEYVNIEEMTAEELERFTEYLKRSGMQKKR